MKPKVDYHGRRFRAVDNTPNGDVSGETEFVFRQQGEVVWATYEGGSVRMGTLVAMVRPTGDLDMRYNHVSADGDLQTGISQSSPELLADGRLRIHDKWQWTSGDRSKGTSILEEVLES